MAPKVNVYMPEYTKIKHQKAKSSQESRKKKLKKSYFPPTRKTSY